MISSSPPCVSSTSELCSDRFSHLPPVVLRLVRCPLFDLNDSTASESFSLMAWVFDELKHKESSLASFVFPVNVRVLERCFDSFARAGKLSHAFLLLYNIDMVRRFVSADVSERKSWKLHAFGKGSVDHKKRREVKQGLRKFRHASEKKKSKEDALWRRDDMAAGWKLVVSVPIIWMEEFLVALFDFEIVVGLEFSQWGGGEVWMEMSLSFATREKERVSSPFLLEGDFVNAPRHLRLTIARLAEMRCPASEGAFVWSHQHVRRNCLQFSLSGEDDSSSIKEEGT